ncbi:MAG: hypothetical protein O9327_10515 [Polaromonas sp.]|nr:hypothetical protein [Polaromonas sp.]
MTTPVDLWATSTSQVGAALRFLVATEVERIYTTTIPPRVRAVLDAGGVPVIIEATQSPKGTAMQGWCLRADKNFVLELIARDVIDGAGIRSERDFLPLLTPFTPVAAGSNDTMARIHSLDEVSAIALWSDELNIRRNVSISRLIKAICSSAEPPPRSLSARANAHADCVVLVDDLGDKAQFSSPDLRARHARLEWLICQRDDQHPDGFQLVQKKASLVFEPNSAWWASEAVLASAIPIWESNGSYPFTSDFVFVANGGTVDQVERNASAEWLAKLLSSPTPWVSEHVLPAVRMRQMKQIATATAINGNAEPQDAMALAKILMGQDLEGNLPIKGNVNAGSRLPLRRTSPAL